MMRMSDQERSQFYVQLPDDVHAALVRAATKENRAISDMVIIALSKELGVKVPLKGYPFHLSRVTGEKRRRTFWMPVELKDALAHRAVDDRTSQSAVFIGAMRKAYGRKRRKAAA
jgi:hypothetical protein